MPRVSVLLPSYNPSQKYALECFAGLEAQTFRDFEAVVIDESDPATTDWMRRQKTNFPLRTIKPAERLGLAKSLNFGIGLCRGEFIARHDMDDVCSPERLSKQVAFLDSNPDVAAVGSWVTTINANSERLGTRKYPTTLAAVRRESALWNPFAHPSIMLRRSFFDTYGFYREDCQTEDYELWLRALGRGAKMLNLAEPLIFYRVESDDRVRPRYWTETAKLRWRYRSWEALPMQVLGITMAWAAAVMPPTMFKCALRVVNYLR